MRRLTFLVCLLWAMPGCLKTVSDVRGDSGDTPTQADTASKNAPAKPPPPVTTASRFEEYDEQLRQLSGRIDVVENGIAQANTAQKNDLATGAKEAQVQAQKFTAYEEELKRLEAQVQALNDQVAQLKAAPPPPPPTAPAVAAALSPPGAKGKNAVYDEAEGQFAAKKWKDAIVSYQKYRDQNPKGKMYGDSTYKIGVSFQELSMKDEAKAFYEEVTAKFPGSKEAKKAALRLKSLK